MFVLSIGSGRARLSRAGDAIESPSALTLTQYRVAPLARRPCRMGQPGASIMKFSQCQARNFSRNLCVRGICDSQGARANEENTGAALGFRHK